MAEKEKRKRKGAEELPSDPKATEKWQSLPQNPPSREALPPATGGIPTIFTRMFPRGVLWLMGFAIVLSLIAIGLGLLFILLTILTLFARSRR